MQNLLQSGAAWLGRQLKTAAGRPVRIEQGTLTIDGLTGVASQFEHEVEDENGFTTKLLSYDWTFTAADLVAGGNPVKLRKGAVVIETLDGREQRYEAMPLGAKPELELLDSSGVLVVLHTKRVG